MPFGWFAWANIRQRFHLSPIGESINHLFISSFTKHVWPYISTYRTRNDGVDSSHTGSANKQLTLDVPNNSWPIKDHTPYYLLIAAKMELRYRVEKEVSVGFLRVWFHHKVQREHMLPRFVSLPITKIQLNSSVLESPKYIPRLNNIRWIADFEL